MENMKDKQFNYISIPDGSWERGEEWHTHY